MIYGIGIDIVQVQRMKEADEKWGRKFFEKILTDDEIAYCFNRSDPYISAAARFAAKEALIKSIGAEVSFSFRDVDIRRNEKGKPCIALQGKIREYFSDQGIVCTHLSLSHEREYAVACVVLEREP